MGADVVIAVNLGTPLAPREQLNSILGIGGQVINILTEQNVQLSLATLKPTDILIVPDWAIFRPPISIICRKPFRSARPRRAR